jgi:hypothetical protein
MAKIHHVIKNRFLEFYQRHEVLVSMTMFASGFLIDIYTIKRIDSRVGLIQQGIYLIILGTLLTLEIRLKSGRLTLSKRGEKFWQYHNLIVHFLFGALLSLYTIFYYTSASALTSFLFILLLLALMLTNEFGKIRKVGLTVRVTLYSICTLSYFSFFYPILLGRIGVLPFWLGILSSILVLTLIWMFNFRGSQSLKKQVPLPALLVHLFFLFAYYTSLIPPVPVAVKKIGVYYEVQRVKKHFVGSHLRPFWDITQLGQPELFKVRTGDKVIVLVSIFSPARFKDQVYLRWYFKHKIEGWVLEDTIPLTILGGRKEGFRGYGSKQFYKLGNWRVIVETSDGREVGRINIKLKKDKSTDKRTFKTDIF